MAERIPPIPTRERREIPQLPDARQILNTFDRDFLPKALKLGMPQLGEAKSDGPELHAKYASISRRHFSELVGLDVLRAVANGGGKVIGEGSKETTTKFVVYEGTEGAARLAHSYRDPDTNTYLQYKQLPDEAEEVEVQHHVLGGIHRTFVLTLRKGHYSFTSMRSSDDETRVHVSGSIREDPQGNITRVNIGTNKFDGF